MKPFPSVASIFAISVMIAKSCLIFGGRAVRALVLLSGLLLFGVLPEAGAETAVNGAIAANTQWTMAEGPYVVTGDVVVQNGAILTIEEGVTVYMTGGTSFFVQSGAVRAVGTESAPIRVLSDKTRLGQIAAAGDWNQWVFKPGTTNTKLEHVLFEHGKGIDIKGCSPELNYLTINKHEGAAITVDLTASPRGHGLRASGNSINGIAVPAGDIAGNVDWALQGIPYVVSSGTLSVGIAPAISSVIPETVQAGQSVTVTVTGTRLSGVSSASFDNPGLAAQVSPGGTNTQMGLQVTASETATVGTATLSLITDAGIATLPNAVAVTQALPTITALSPSTLFVGQGITEISISGRGFGPQSTAQINGSVVSTQVISGTLIKAAVPNQVLAATLQVTLRTPDPSHIGQFLTSNAVPLEVAPAQIALSPGSITVSNGFSKALTVTLPYAAPTGGMTISLVSSVPSVATVPSTVSIPEGARTVTFDVTGAGLGTTTITASKVGFVSGQANVTVVAPPSLTISPNQLTLGVGRSAEITIQSSTPAPAGGTVVTLTSSDDSLVTVTTSATIPPGATSISATLATVAIGNATVQAKAEGFVSGTATVTVRPVSLNLPSGALVSPGLTRSIPITLSDPAPVGGLVVALTSSDPAVATVSTSLTIPSGQTTGNFTLSGVAAGASTITATATGYQSGNMPVTVAAVTISLGSAISIPVEEDTGPLSVTLSQPAPAGGVVVDLAISDPSKASVVPASISIPQGQTSGGVAKFSVTGVMKGNTTLVASAAGLNSANVSISVTGKPELRFSASSAIVGKGLISGQSDMYIYRVTDGREYYGKKDVAVSFTSSDTSKLSLPSAVTIPAGNHYAYFTVRGVDLTSTPVTIDATATGYTTPATKLSTTVINPTFQFVGLDGNRSTESGRDNFYVRTYVPGASSPYDQTAAVNLPIDLSIVNDTPAGLVPGFHDMDMPAGGNAVSQVVLWAGYSNTYNSSYLYTYVDTPTLGGTYQVKASTAGGASGVSATQTVAAPELRFSRSTVTAGKGLNTYWYEVNVCRTVNGTDVNGANEVTVNLTSSDASKASVPATVTIPGFASCAYFTVRGVDLTGSTPVTIDATATGYRAPATKLATTVINPTFQFLGLDGNRSTESARDDFYVRTYVPGASYAYDQTAAVDLPITLSIVGDTPAGLVPGFHDAATGGNAVSQVVLKADQSMTYHPNGTYVYIDTPTSGGTYQIKASTAGGASSVSATQTVAAPELRFSMNTVTVGKGLNTYQSEVYVYRTVNGTNLSGANPVTVNLTSSDASKASVPATVTIPAGSYYTYFTVRGVDLTSTPVTIDATATGYTTPAAKLTATVINPTLQFNSLDGNRSTDSARDNFYVRTYVPGASNPYNQTAAVDLPITLSIVGDTPSGLVPGFHDAATGGNAVNQVVLKAGQFMTYYPNNTYVYVDTPTSGGTYQVKASTAGGASSVSATQTVAAPELRFSMNAVTVGKGLNTYQSEVYVYRTVNGNAVNGVSPVTVNLACSSTEICNVPASVTIPAGTSSVYFKITGVGIGTTTITASAIGYSSVQDLGVNVIAPQLTFSGPGNTTVGHTSNFQVHLNVPGASYPSNQTAVAVTTLSLTSSAPGVATVPGSVAIPIGNSWTNSLALTGVAPGTTKITASGDGLVSATSPTITVSP